MKKKKLVIVDYRLGNIFSVKQACEKTGLTPEVSSDMETVAQADALILPGVGAFGEAMDHLKDLGLVEPIRQHVASGKPLMGICLGLQLLFTESEEFGVSKGLDIIPGVVRKIRTENNGQKRLVPEIGWNRIHKKRMAWEETPLKDTSPGDFFYFVHSYYVEPSQESHVLTNTVYDGLEYCSAVMKDDNVFATQFHPEKSAHKGLEIYHNWAKKYNII